MFKFQELDIFITGVMNITPDSFSNQQSHLSQNIIQDQLQELSQSCDVIDIGAESTAPMNSPILFQEEIKRLQDYLLPSLKNWPKHIQFSLDTYHSETVEWFLKENQHFSEVIWNDISGCADEDVARILKAYPHLRYVLTFTFVPHRSVSGKHQEFLKSEVDIETSFQIFLKQHENFLLTFKDRIILDPGFGFSKTRDQNLDLIKKLPKIMSESGIKDWMIAISRKSFLRNPINMDPKKTENQILLDSVQFLTFEEMFKNLHTYHRIYLRTHNAESLLALKR